MSAAPRHSVLFCLSNVHRMTGSQRSLLAFLTGCESSRLRALVVVPCEGPATTAFREAGLRVLIMPPPPQLQRHGGALLRAGFVERITTGLRDVLPYSLRMARIIKDECIDIAHFNEPRALLMAGLSARLAGVPSVWHVRGDLSGLGSVYLHACGWLPNRIILVADGIRQCIPAVHRSKCVTVYNGINPPTVPSTRTRRELLELLDPPVSEDVVLVAVIGSLVPFKGAHHVLGAAGALQRSGRSKICFVLVGDRPDADYSRLLDARMEELALKNVRFVGWDWQPLDWIRAADIVTVASVQTERLELGGEVRSIAGSEGLPRVILEAMACGRPVVATSVAGVPEQIVDGVTGLLVSPGEEEALAHAIEKLADDLGLRAAFGEAATRRACDLFSVRANVEGTLAVYDQLRN